MSLEALQDWWRGRDRIAVLTGAGMSTGSGIPDYRDEKGEWKHSKPVMFQDFIGSDATRQRYWGRSLVGWHRISTSQPNVAHQALAALQHDGPVTTLITQNVDGLHQQAGSSPVIDLHGRLSNVICMGCDNQIDRVHLQDQLMKLNPGWIEQEAQDAPDGDARLVDAAYQDFRIADCEQCGGMLKPDVVFFGESVPKHRVERAFEAVDQSEGLLVAGSSLMVFSGYRFVRQAKKRKIDVAIVNLGITRGDSDATIKVEQSCEVVLPSLAS